MIRSILIQARLSSARFPGKMLMPLAGMPLAEYVYRRCQRSKRAGLVAIITSQDSSDDRLVELCRMRGWEVFRGPLDNVLERYILAADHFRSDVVCRVCGDSPFVDVDLIDTMFDRLAGNRLEYIAPDRETIIAGLDAEIITKAALKRSLPQCTSQDELEHVSVYIKGHPEAFRIRLVEAGLRPAEVRDISLTVDHPEDLVLCNAIAARLNGEHFSSSDIISALMENRELFDLGRQAKRAREIHETRTDSLS